MNELRLFCYFLVASLLASNCQGEDLPKHGNRCALWVVNEKLDRSVCVCNKHYCDDLVFEWPRESGEAFMVQSTKAGQRFHLSKTESLFRQQSVQSNPHIIDVNVNLTDEHQSVLGFGGAFTDAATMNIQSLSNKLQRKLMHSYFGEHGSQYTFGRVVIAGADFSVRPYSYDDMPRGSSDFNLTHWSLAPEDYKFKIPTIKEAQRIVSKQNRTLKLFGSSWSPPAFMKTNESLVRGFLIDRDEVYRSYANYLVNFYEAYKKEGINFWGGTVQNEPVTAFQPSYNFNSLELGIKQTIKFVGKFLGPALVAKNYTKQNFKLMINDDSLDLIYEQAPEILKDVEVQKYVAGLAFHWYNNWKVPYDTLVKCIEKVKDHIEFVLMTEACNMPGKEKAVELGSWERGEKYANDIIQDMWNQAGGWVDWNLALDEMGGPNWVANFVDSPVIVNPSKDEFYKQPMYYILAHFSRFFRPGSVRLGVSVTNRSGNTIDDDHELMAIAVKKKDTNHVVVNILNKSENKKVLNIKVTGKSKQVKVQGRSMNTVVLKL